MKDAESKKVGKKKDEIEQVESKAEITCKFLHAGQLSLDQKYPCDPICLAWIGSSP